MFSHSLLYSLAYCNDSSNHFIGACIDKQVDGTPKDNTPESIGRKRKAIGIDNLVDFINDFNNENLTHIEVQKRDRQAWKSNVLAFDTMWEARIAHKEVKVVNMDKKLHKLEVERTHNLENMNNALLMMASSMDVLARFITTSSAIIMIVCSLRIHILIYVVICTLNLFYLAFCLVEWIFK